MKKKFTTYAAAAVVMLTCTACAGIPGTPETKHSPDAVQPDLTVHEITPESNAAPEPDTDTGAGENTDAGQADSTAPSPELPGDVSAQDVPDSAQSVQITITYETEESDEAAKDGTVVYTSSCIYPVVAIEGNDSAADKINEDIQSKVAAFRGDTSTLDYAREGYDYYIQDGNDGSTFIQYTNDLWFSAVRSDSNVISFVMESYGFSGGAHGYTALNGVNYDTKTGEVISFHDLSDNPEKFHADTLAYNQMLAETDSYRERMFEPSMRGDLEEVLYAENKWYLSTSGLTFISDPYSLGPYAAGTIEFVIPYADLEQMGLKGAFSYAGNLTIPLPAGEEYTIDLNGDGSEDTIQYSTEQIAQDDGTYASLVHLVINGTDFAQDGGEELVTRLSDCAWADCVLYDISPADGTVEIVFMILMFDTGEEEVLRYSSCFRYEKDGTLTWAGMSRGNVTDPSFVF